MGSTSGALLRACMIDGFGAFEEADYRRSWLFFENVDYVLPARLAGPIAIPPLEDRQDFALKKPEVGGPDLERILAATRRDTGDDDMRTFVVERVPAHAREYASILVWSDEELRDHVTDAEPIDPVFGYLFLANKLLWYAARSAAVPIVGRADAAELLERKAALLGTRFGHGLLGLRGSVRLSAFAAGLALDFVDDDQLARVPIKTLLRFKERNRELLVRHQLHLVKVAQEFTALADSGDFAERLAELRLEARRERFELDIHARKAWTDSGLEVLKKALTAASAGLFSGLAVLRGHRLEDILVAALPAAVAAGGIVAAAVVEGVGKARPSPIPAMAYLFRAREAVDR